jgi:hypothetical protein
MKLYRVIIFILTIVVPLALMVNVCSASSAASVDKAWAGMNPNDDSGQVTQGSIVNIYWTGVVASADGNTVDIKVIDPNGNQVAFWTGLGPSASGTIHFEAAEYGTYGIIMEGHPTYYKYSTTVAASSVFALPETALGTLMALASGFAAFGVLGIAKTKRTAEKRQP